MRAIGQANKSNLFLIIIPCHRVIGKNNNLIGYAGAHTDVQLKLIGVDDPKLSNSIEIKYISNYIRAGRNATLERAQESLNNNEEKIKKLIIKIQEKQIAKISRGKNLVYSYFYNIWRYKYKNRDRGFNVNDDCIG